MKNKLKGICLLGLVVLNGTVSYSIAERPEIGPTINLDWLKGCDRYGNGCIGTVIGYPD